MALPLGELSPQVTERVLPPFLNNKINLCAHTVCPLRPRRARPPLPQGEARDTHTVHRKVHRSARFICPSAAITALERSSGKHRMAAGTETVLRPPRPSRRELLLFVQQAHMNHGPVQAVLPQGRGDVFRLGLHLCRGVAHDQGVSHTRQHFQVVGTVADGVAVG